MGILGSKKKTKQEHVFENPEKYVTPTGDEIKKAMISPQEHVEEVKTETEEYYERILRNSRLKNTALKLKSIDSSEKEGWTTVSTRRTPVFRQKLPAARDTYKARKAEDKAKKDARRTFCYADLNTVREKASLETYFGAWKQGDPGYSGEDAADDPALTEYVQGILSMELNNAVFTDDYLSDHMAEMFEYTRKLRHYTFMKQKYPNFFAHLSDDKKALLETRVAASGAVGEILKAHMKLHGLELDRSNKGFKVRMVQQTAKNNAQRERDKTKHEQDLKSFLDRNVYEEEVNLARTYTDLKSFRSKNAAEELGGRLAGYKEALSSCGEEITLASGEMEKAWKVRDGLLADQKILLRHYDEEKNEVKKSEYRLKIVRNNRRIRLASNHADHYRDFLDFVTGQVSSVKRGTARFLEAENQEALLDIIRLKAMGDCLEEGFVASDKMEASRRAKELRKDIEVKSDPKNKDWEVIDYKEQSAVEANELEQFVRNSSYLSMPMDSFYALVRNYKQVKKKSNKFTSLVNKAEKNQRAGKKAASYFASTGHFDKISENDRFGVLFLDPFNEEEARINVAGREMNRYEAFQLYCGYTPGERSDSKTVQEVTEKAIKPLLDEFLAMTPEKVAGMKCPEDPDLESREFWHNRSIVFALYDTLVNLQNLDRWDIPLSDEQRAHLIALGKVAETEIGAYQTFETRMNDPLSVILKDDRLKGDTLNKLHNNVFFPYYDDGEPDDPKVAKRIGRFGADNPGLKVDIAKKKAKQKTAIPEAMGYYISGLYAQQNSAIKGEGKADAAKLYESKRREALKSMEDARNAPVRDELKKIRQFFPEATEAEARARISEEKLQERIKKSVTGDMERLWKLNLGSTSKGAGDIRSFAIFLRPVEYTANGQVEKKSKDNHAANERDIADYASGNPAYRNRVLRRIGKEVCAMKITDEMFTLEYMQQHPEEIFEIIEKVHGLQNIVEEYADFFVSDAFTEEERDILRQRILDSKALSNLSAVFGVYKQSYLGDMSMKNVKMTDKEKLDWGKRNRDTNLNLARVMAEDESELGLKGALEIHKKRVALYADKDKADRIRRASVLWAKTKSELAKAKKEKEFMSLEKTRLPEGSKKARLMAKRDQLVAEYEEKINATKAKLALAEEIQSYVYEEKESLSPEAQKLFDAEAKETVIHAEYEKGYAERVEEIRADQAKTEAARKAAEGEEPVEKRAQDLSKDALFNAMAELEEEDVSEDMSGGQEIKEEIHQEDRIHKEAPGQPEVIQKASVQEQVQAPGQQQVLGPVYHAESSLAEGTSYEVQDIQNCWACSGAALFNKFAELQDGHVTAPLNQFDIRGYEPKPEELKSLDEVNAISSVQLDKEGYDNTAAELYNYMGTGKMGSGSIFEVSDFFLKKRRDFVLNQMEFRMNGGMSEKDIAAYNAQKGLFMKQVNDVLSTGNLVALYKPSGQHYLTITKIDGDMITYLDSNKPVGQMEKTEHVEMVFSRNEEGSNMSITWFSALKDPEEMKKDHPGLQYDEQQGYSHAVKEELYAGALNLAQKEGICITKSQSDPVLGQDAVKIHTYIPKHP
ncbi:MAG: hypothetical protein K6E90_05870 [Lachnospiraceae bacterium]|nr:hypothetical protein [Lachnospiraceae bacterium]